MRHNFYRTTVKTGQGYQICRRIGRGSNVMAAVQFAFAAVLLMVCPESQATEESTRVYQINLPAQNVAKALTSLSEQTDLQVLFPYDIVEARRANTVVGEFTLTEALSLLLNGTGLSGGLTDSGVVTISRKPSNKMEGDQMNSKKTKTSFFAAVPAALLSVVTPATVSGQAADSTVGATVLEEVVVTAQKRVANAQRVPISITALSDEVISRLPAANLGSIQGMIPNVQIGRVSNSYSSGVFSIRGVGQIDADPFIGTTVTVVQDGVLQGTNTNALFNLLDVERVEVLRGPQGTLFGASSTGGVINIITKQPTGEFSADVQVDYGNYDALNLTGILNFPIIEDVLVGKLSVAKNDRDGFYTNAVGGEPMGGQDITQIRGYLKMTPGEGVDATLIGEYNRGRNGSPIVVNLGVPGELLYRAPGCGEFNGQKRVDFSCSANDGPDLSNNDQYAGTLTVNVETGIGTMTSITGYREYDLREFTDQDGLVDFIIDTDRRTTHWQFSQELRLATTPTDDTELMVGFFYRDWNYKLFQYFGQEGFVPGLSNAQTHDADYSTVAVFAHGYWDVTPKIRLQGGVRWNEDKANMVATNTNFLNCDPPSFATAFGGPGSCGLGRSGLGTALPGGVIVEENETWREVGGNVGAQYQFTEDVMLYVTYAHGIKSGGFNGRIGVPEDVGPYDPEFVDTVEVGVKADLLGRRVRANLNFFINDYKDMQLRTAYLTEDFQSRSQIFNAGAATTQGVELETTAIIFPGFTVNFAGSYLDAQYDEFIFRDADGPNVVDFDYKGRRLINSPRWMAHGGFTYEAPVAGGELNVHLDYSYVDRRYTDIQMNPITLQRSYELVNSKVEWGPDGADWSISAYCTNCFDFGYIPYSSDEPGIWTHSSYGNPQQYGVSFRAMFD